MSAEFQSIYDGLVSQYGGPDALTTVHLAVLRRLATVLASDDAFTASAVTSLTALLPDVPGKAAAGGPSEWDLSALSDHDVDALIGLAARACALRTPDGAPISVAPSPSAADLLERAEAERVALRDELRLMTARALGAEALQDGAFKRAVEAEAREAILAAELAVPRREARGGLVSASAL